ncbi:type I-C CRISPR-associated protein Cas8c/Csd1 [Candidatus Brocadia sapporoensis]|uniref:Type I-C CRISPR-associated protein Cas8c/Csd1 n=1 Tax=Candidatus Brocadia sapporoensis TaxID=392547 RepID=A0A1V6M0R7_9BACT|nr:type I-C CRISPR-associated protein Cas8c/Csd1 [Candidatus Brocadia sapporoensis]OQD45989.1 type I-C CRISPR-associated protein Cas8c/Csd1 [Candidatus Brocadia sapporoensis]GJQ23437.1 MAG: type I-C CRISPR-associated protein Cas8c/Csd1 [Candidatus Brocadia sapporoensis]
MILQALAKYYERIPDVEDEGFQKQEIPFIVVLNRQGNFLSMVDTRSGDGKKKTARSFMVPKAVKRSSGIAANLLWDTPAYIFGKPKPDKKKDMENLFQRAKEQQKSFLDKIVEIFTDSPPDEGVAAVIHFLKQKNYDKLFSHPQWQEIEESGANVTFQLEGETELICQHKVVKDAIASTTTIVSDDQCVCLISGNKDSPARLHTAIKGVWGSQSSGANVVSFNLPAFNSFGKEQGYNAPVGRKIEFAYTTALNTLLVRGSRQRIQVGDASTVFWAEKRHGIEDWFADIFGEPAIKDSDQDNAAIKALFKSPETGAKPVLDNSIKFYVLGLSPNASRIAIRFWYAGTIAEVEENIRQHFTDIAIDRAPHQPEYLSLFRLLVSTAVQGKSDNIQPNLAGDFMKAILSWTPYPNTLLSSAIRRTKAEQEVTYQRASLIKAVLVRKARYKNEKEEIRMALDTSNTNTGYLLGRLFATLEKIQEEASPGINATIRDRFYSSASSTPVTVFSHLMKLKNHHIAKLENKGRAVNFEKLLGEIVDDVKDFPAHLSLDDQGRFAVGYYHQRQDFFKKRDNN